MDNKCRKFEANIFNKTKCQNCFKAKEDHSAEALECTRNSRKITAFGYLFVAPDSFNFSNPLDRTKRWQRRFFVLYDDGDLSYSVDENVSTVPQGIIDMNQCSEVFSAEVGTGHQYSVGIKSQERVTYVKGTSKDEIGRWLEFLNVYPQNFKAQSRQKRPHPNSANANSSSQPTPTQNGSVLRPNDDLNNTAAMNNKVTNADKVVRSDEGFLSGKRVGNAAATSNGDAHVTPRTTSYVLTGSKQQTGSTRRMETDPSNSDAAIATKAAPTGVEKVPQTYRGVRNMKHKNDKTYNDNLRKSSSLQNLTSTPESSEHGERPSRPRTRVPESSVSGFGVSLPASPHGSHTSLSMTNRYCMYATPRRPRRHDLPLVRSEYDHGSIENGLDTGSLARHRSSTALELEKFSKTNIVSNTAQFWEQKAHDSDASQMSRSRSHSRDHLADDLIAPRLRHTSSSPFRNQPLSRDFDRRPRTRSRTVAVENGRLSTDSSTDGWELRAKRERKTESLTVPVSFASVNAARALQFRDHNRNETDEFKISKTSPDVGSKNSDTPSKFPDMDPPDKDLTFVKRGWLLKQSIDKSWKKCWCVLNSNCLTYYNDSKQPETLENVEGIIVLTADTEIEEINTLRNFAFRVMNKANEHVLSAMTSGIRTSWIQAITRCVNAFTDIPTQFSSLDSASNAVMSWRSFPTSDSDMDYDIKSKDDSVSSWPSSSAWPYVKAGNSTTFAGHGSNVEDLVVAPVFDTPDLLDRVHPGQRGRRKGDEHTRTGTHSYPSTADANQGRSRDLVDGKFIRDDEQGRPGFGSRLNSDQDRLTSKKDALLGSQLRAPSTRILERARAKSPKRAKSPPPSAPVPGASLDLGRDGSPESRRFSAENFLSRPRGSSENTLLDLMKHEVAELRQQLDATRSELEESQSVNANIRSMLLKSSQECQNLTETLEAEKKEYISQMNLLKTKLSDSNALVDTQNKDLLELRNKNQRLVERERNKLDQERLELQSVKQEVTDKTSLVSRLEADLRGLRKTIREKDDVVALNDKNWEERVEKLKAKSNLEREALISQFKEMENRVGQLTKQSETVSVESSNMANILKNKDLTLSQLEEKLTEKERKLECTLKELELEMEDNTRIHKELDEYCKENAVLKMQLEVEAEKASGLEADVRHLREEKQELRALTSEKETKNALFRQDVDRVESQLKTLADENTRLKTELEGHRESQDGHQSELKKKTGDLDKLRSDFDTQMKENKFLNQTVEELKSARDAASTKALELEKKLAAVSSNVKQSSEEFHKFTDENGRLKKEVTSLEELVEKVMAESETKLRNCEEIKSEKEKRILQLQCECGDLIEQQKTLKREHQTTLTRNEALKSELTSLKAELSAQLEAKCKELKQCESRNKTLQGQVEAQKSAIEAQKSAVERSKMTEREDGDGSAEDVTDKDSKEKCASLTKQVKQLLVEKQKAESRCAELELSVQSVKQDQRNSEVSRANEVEQLGAKVQELTTKLNQLERRNLRLERSSRSSDDPEQRTESAEVSHAEARIKNSKDDEILDQTKAENERLLAENQTLLEQLKQAGITAEENHLSKTDIESQILEKEGVIETIMNDLEDLKSEMARREAAHVQEVQVLKDGYKIRIQSLEQDVSGGRSDLAQTMEEQSCDFDRYKQDMENMEMEIETLRTKHDKENASLLDTLNTYKGRVREYEGRLKVAHKELEEAKLVGDSRNVPADQEMNILKEEFDELQKLLREERARHMLEIGQLKNAPNVDPARASEIDAVLRVKELEEQIQNMKFDYEHELQMQRASHRRELMNSKEDVMQLLVAAEANSIPIDEESIRKKYMKELEQIKDIYDKGVSNMEKSHQRTMMEMRRNHKMELDRLRQEKDQLLKEEAQATQAALEAMRKAHESELQKERNKFLDLISKTYSHADMETLHRQHEEDLELLHYEMKQLSEKYSVKCLENAALTERLLSITKSLHENRKRVQDLLARNDELTSQLKFKVERLSRAVGLQLTKADKDMDIGTDKQDMSSAEVKLQVNEMEILQLRKELENAKLDVVVKTEELKEYAEKYHELCDELTRRKSSVDQGSQLTDDDDDDSLSSVLLTGRSGSSLLYKRSFGERERSGRFDNLDFVSSSPYDTIERLDDGADDTASQRGDSRLSGQMETGAEAEFGGHRRSLWRFKNPQRSRSNPSVPNPATLQKSLSVNADLLPPRPSCSSPTSSIVVADDTETTETSPTE